MRFAVGLLKLWLMLVVAVCVAGCQLAQNQSETKDDSLQVMQADRLARYKANLPKFAFDRINQMLADQNTFWYDRADFEPMFQDSSFDEATGLDSHLISSGQELMPEGAKNLFAGSTFSQPFDRSAGLSGTNASVVHFVNLPLVDGSLLPILHWVQEKANGSRWNWTFPAGTVVGELVFVEDPEGQFFLTELRTRTRYQEGWAANIFRPFPTAKHLKVAVQKIVSNWQENPELQGLLSHLDDQDTLVPVRLDANETFPGVISRSGYTDVLPAIDSDLVKQLLTRVVFTSSYKAKWKESVGKVAYAPQATQEFSIVPKNFAGGLYAVTEDSCADCHQDAGRNLEDFNPAASGLGEVWGEDQIFSFHILADEKLVEAGADNRRLNNQLIDSGLVKTLENDTERVHYPRLTDAVEPGE